MERTIIYLLALVNLCVGLKLFYRRPRPFGRGTYEDYPEAAHPRGLKQEEEKKQSPQQQAPEKPKTKRAVHER